MNDEEYFSKTELSNSMLSVLAKPNGPQLFKLQFVDKTYTPPASEAMNLGSMVHCLALEPHEYDDRFALKPDGLDRVRVAGKAAYKAFESNRRFLDLYVPKPDLSRRTAEGKAEYDAIVLDRIVLEREDFDQACYFFKELCRNSGKTIVKESEAILAQNCATAIRNHAALRDVLKCEAAIEQPVFFELDGVNMRCKPDWVSYEHQLVIDVKTTQDAGLDGFAKSAFQYRYHAQAWLYRDALREKTGLDFRFLFAVVDTNFPHSTAVYEPDDEMMRLGEESTRRLLAEYRYRYESGDWVQEWSKGIVPLALPKWAK